MRSYESSFMAELACELACGLLRLRRGYVDQAETLLRLTDPDQEYPHSFVVFRLTGYRPRERGSRVDVISGKTLRKDLLTLILDVSESFELASGDYDEAVYDTAALAKKMNVSTKTVDRWRRRGLPARRVVFPDGRRRVGFLQSSVDWFTQLHDQSVKRSASFSKLTDEQRDNIIEQARLLREQYDANFSEIVRELAKRSGRACETIRYTIRRHDRENPAQAVFPDATHPLTDDEKRRICRSFLRGLPMEDLVRQYRRSRSSLYRVVNEMWARQLKEREIEFIPNPIYEKPGAESLLFGQAAGQDKDEEITPLMAKAPIGLPPYLRSLYEVPLLKPEEEKRLFMQFNFLKYKARKACDKLNIQKIRAGQLKNIESLLQQADAIKNRIVRANLRLVVSIAKRHLEGPMGLFELVSDGNISLMRAVEKFDVSRGFRFSTYASWAIMRNYARSVPRERTQLDRFSTGHEELLDIAAGLKSYNPQDDNLSELRESIDAMFSHLTPRERTILTEHYGLGDQGESRTFEHLGRELGISKERVRQIEIQALKKLRDVAGPEM